MRRVYLDNNATTPLLPEARRAMLEVLDERFGNPSSAHSWGRAARAVVDSARRRVAALIGARPSTVVFTSGGTEADHLALRAGTEGGGHVVTSAIEHHAVLDELRALEAGGAIELTVVPVGRDGVVDGGAMIAALRPDTTLVSLMLANNETGVIQPLRELAAHCRERGITVHTDAVQAIGKIGVDVAALSVDLLSLSAHKFGGPKGIGALYVRRGLRFAPLHAGGGQERGIRPGTENVAGIAGIGAAAEAVGSNLAPEAARLRGLRDALETRLLEELPGIVVNGAGADRIANTSSLTLEGIDAEALMLALDLEGIAISTGSACTTGAMAPSHVLTALGLDSAATQSTVRVAWGRVNDAADLDLATAKLIAAMRTLRAGAARNR